MDDSHPAPGADPSAPAVADGATATTPDDPEILALLEFEPVPRRNRKEGGWNAEMQRLFIARLAVHGSPGKAAREVGMYRSGVDKVFHSKGAESFQAAWAAAVALADRRRAEEVAAGHAGIADIKMPFLDNRRKMPAAPAAGPGPGQMLNEHGEYEDEESLHRRAEESRDAMSSKLLSARRLYLAEISASPGKRAAFEILTRLPIDWERAAAFAPQPDEPFRPPNFRAPDMLLTAENGWMGEIVHGPDKLEELRRAISAHLAEHGMPAVDWDSESESSEPKPNDGEADAWA